MNFNGVINNNGDLLRAGYSDFTNSLGSGESQVNNIPSSPFITRDDHDYFHRWTGTQWVLIEKESAILNKWNLNTNKDYKYIRSQMSTVVNASGWNNMNTTEKVVACQWFVVDQEKRSQIYTIEQQVQLGMKFHTESIKARQQRFLFASMEVYNRLDKTDADKIIMDIESDSLSTKYINFGHEGINCGDPESLFDYVLATSGTSYENTGIAKQDINPSGMTKTQFIDKLIDIVASGNYP